MQTSTSWMSDVMSGPTSIELLRYAGWAAYLSAAATIITFVTAIVFFRKGQPFGTVNDAASVFQMLFMVPIVLALHQLMGPSAETLSVLAAAIGIIGMLVGALLQALLVFGKVKCEQTIGMVLTAGGAIGVWLVLTGYLALAGGMLPSGLAWLGLIAGGGYILSVVGFRLGGERNPLFWIGSLVTVSGYSTWALWLGRVLLSGTLTV
jgi:hypothetical protein